MISTRGRYSIRILLDLDVYKRQVYNTYYPMFTIMIGTGLRCGELIGLTWKDINIKAKTVNVDHQLIYKRCV